MEVVLSANELNQLCVLYAFSSLRYQCITPFTLRPYRPAPQRESTTQLLLKFPREDAGTNKAMHVSRVRMRRSGYKSVACEFCRTGGGKIREALHKSGWTLVDAM
jgi:hypothetical protein